MSKLCPKCGLESDGRHSFCLRCGTHFDTAENDYSKSSVVYTESTNSDAVSDLSENKNPPASQYRSGSGPFDSTGSTEPSSADSSDSEIHTGKRTEYTSGHTPESEFTNQYDRSQSSAESGDTVFREEYSDSYTQESAFFRRISQLINPKAGNSFRNIPLLLPIWLGSAYILFNAEWLANPFSTIAAILCLFSPFLFVFSQKLGRDGRKFGIFFCRSVLILQFLLLISALFTAGSWTVDSAMERIYDARMKPLLEKSNREISSDRVTVYFSNENRFSRSMTPSDLRTDRPEDTEFIVIITEYNTRVSSYAFADTNQYAGNGYVRSYNLSWYDRETGESMLSHTLYGTEPPDNPSAILHRSRDYYGNPPTDTEVRDWISSSYTYILKLKKDQRKNGSSDGSVFL